MDIWVLGVAALAAYESVAEVGQEVLETANKIKSYRNWHTDMEINGIYRPWHRTFRKVIHRDLWARRQDIPDMD